MGGYFPPEVTSSKDEPVSNGGFPTPGFEGFEKRLEVEFSANFDSVTDWYNLPATSVFRQGLRKIPREELDVMLDAAACTIVSHLPNEVFDSYVLSESSLFVYTNRVVIKTCGTTKLLKAIPSLLESAARIGFQPRRCRYTRGTFLFPEAQPSPHSSFDMEAMELEKHFGHLGSGGRAYVLGDALKFPNWHVYVADAAPSKSVEKAKDPVFTLEMCMTKLDRTVANQFYQGAGFNSSAHCTKDTGIGDLLPKSQIDDFLFEPCGYSMNGIEDGAHSTIHITPEDGFSYASFEAMGYGESNGPKLGDLINKVAAVFKPQTFSVALHADGPATKSGPGSWGSALPELPGYVCTGTSKKELPLNSSLVFHTFHVISRTSLLHEVKPLPLLVESPAVPGMEKKQLKPTIPQEFGFSTVEHVDADVAYKFGAAVGSAMSDFEPVKVGSSNSDLDRFISSVIQSTDAEEAFYVFDMGVLLRLWETWVQSMPRVKPFYAVKCNPDPALLSLLSTLGSGFDCASKAELEAVSKWGVDSDRIIFANPCKLPSHISYAAKQGVHYTTFDSRSELMKLKKHNPNAKAVLRLRADDRGARCPLGVKYGAEYEDCEELLLAAKELGVHVAGIAFHVGSGASDARSFADGIAAARSLFDLAVQHGMPAMDLLDIGGGFTSSGGSGVSFFSAAAAINEALDLHFPEPMAVQIIGEPGRFFAEAPATLVTNVFGTRFRGKGQNKTSEYWINDGIYGSMNCLLYDHAELSCRPLPSPEKQAAAMDAFMGGKLYKSTVFGPTCDGLDTVLRDVWLPKLDCGDWLIFPRMGAYTQAAGSSFNGFSTADIQTVYVYSAENDGSECSDGSSADDSCSSDGGDEAYNTMRSNVSMFDECLNTSSSGDEEEVVLRA